MVFNASNLWFHSNEPSLILWFICAFAFLEIAWIAIRIIYFVFFYVGCIINYEQNSFPSCHSLEAVVRRCSVKQVFLKISRKFTGKYLCQSPFIKKEALAQVVSCEFCGIFKNTFFYITTPPLAASDSSDSNYYST